MRDVQDEYTPLVCTFFRPSCVQKTRLTNESEVSSPSNRRYQCLCAGGGAGRPKACRLLGRTVGFPEVYKSPFLLDWLPRRKAEGSTL